MPPEIKVMDKKTTNLDGRPDKKKSNHCSEWAVRTWLDRECTPQTLDLLRNSTVRVESLGSIAKAVNNSDSVYPSPPNSPPRPSSTVTQTHEQGKDRPLSSASAASRPIISLTSTSSKVSTSTLKEEESEGHKIQVDAVNFRKLLVSKQGMLCGAIKKGALNTGDNSAKSSYCEMRPLVGNRKELDCRIMLMATSRLSFPELEAKLCGIAKLVHCRHHNYGYPIDERVYRLAEKYASGDYKIGIEIRKALRPLSSQCMVIANRQDRCKQYIGGRRLEICRRAIYILVERKVYLNDSDLDHLLKHLESNMYCDKHSKDGHFQEADLWKSRITDVCKDISTEVQSEANVNRDGATDLNSQALQTAKKSRAPAPDIEEVLATLSKIDFDITAFDILRKSNEISSCDWKKRVQEKMLNGIEVKEESLKKHLKTTQANVKFMTRIIGNSVEQLEVGVKFRKKVLEEGPFGYVYLYEVEGNDGYIKIGYTTKDVKTRLSEWTFQCNRKAKARWPKGIDTTIAIPHPRFIEALCHTALAHCQTSFYCYGCLEMHREWFKIPCEKGIVIVEKLVKWMETSPYEKSEVERGNARWKLKKEALEGFSTLFQNVEV